MTARPDRPGQVQGLADRRRRSRRHLAAGLRPSRRTLDGRHRPGRRRRRRHARRRDRRRASSGCRSTAAGPTGVPVDTRVRAAAASGRWSSWPRSRGLALLPGERRGAADARPAAGTGEVIGAALDAGCRGSCSGIGGSASTDGGAGLLQRSRAPGCSTPRATTCAERRRGARARRPARPGRAASRLWPAPRSWSPATSTTR